MTQVFHTCLYRRRPIVGLRAPFVVRPMTITLVTGDPLGTPFLHQPRRLIRPSDQPSVIWRDCDPSVILEPEVEDPWSLLPL